MCLHVCVCVVLGISMHDIYIGSIGWGEYPTLRIMMEMVMTQNYSLPEDTPAMEVKV